jgi:hypothetical protein
MAAAEQQQQQQNAPVTLLCWLAGACGEAAGISVYYSSNKKRLLII